MAKLEKIGKYEILGQIAAGGFGVVYKARDPFIKRLVAIKTCPADNEDLRNRFFREAEIVGNLKHPNITIVHDFGVEGDFAYLVQEYLSGEDLLAKIRDKRALELSEKLEILLQVGQGLGYAHAQGVIHRDVKPGNIRVLEDGKVKIMDFGIAKLITARTQLTQKGMTVGTVGYLAPEQVSDGEVTQRTDIFGFGVLAYEFLTYRRPFRGRTLGELIPRIMKEEPPPISTLVIDATPPLDELLRRCLAKNPRDRYASFDEVVDELGAILSEAQLAAALPGDVVERTVRLETGSSALAAASAEARTRVEVLPPAAPSAPTSSPPAMGDPRAAAAKNPLDDTRPVILVDELESAAEGVERPAPPATPLAAPPAPPPPAVSKPVVAVAKPPAPSPAPVPIRPVGLDRPDRGSQPSASASPTRPREVVAPMPPPDPDLSMSGFAPPSLPSPGDGSHESAAEAPAIIGGGGDVSHTSGGLGIGRVLILMAAVLILLGGMAAGLWYLLSRPKAPPAVVEVPVGPAVDAKPVAPPPPSAGWLVVNAAPWGTVDRIVADDGTELVGAPFGATPRMIAVPPGTYRVEIGHPDLPAPVVCEVTVAESAAGECQVSTAPPDVNSYFRESGWWR